MKRVAIAAVAVSLLIVDVFAQSNRGTLRGVVVDTSGEVLPGVEVKVADGSGFTASTVTDVRGVFEFRNLEPGGYSVTAFLAGFIMQTATAAVPAGRTITISFTLEISALTETVTVTAASPVIDTSTSAVMAQAATKRFNTEAYDRIVENPWIDAVRTPLSTFSTDVDTASYSNVRRFLNEGEAPPKDAVRIEELINYFTFDYPEPRGGRPVSITTAIGDCPWNTRHRLALIGLQARRIDASTLPPRNLVFLVDVSGSMEDANKLPLVKDSLALLARNLTDRDRIAIVVYAGSSGLVLPPTSGRDTSTILGALQELEAGGSTNGAEGLLLAYQVAQEQFIPKGVNRVILATDGDFNVGVTDQGALLRLIEEKRASGIALSVLGYGMGNVKDSTMEKLADAGNGNYAYIDSIAEARKVLVEQAGGTLVTVAKDVKLQVEFNPRVVGAYRLIGYENRLLRDEDFNDDRKDAGDMGAGHSVTALYEIVPAGLPSDASSIDPLKYQVSVPLSAAAQYAEAMTVKVRYKAPDGGRSSLMTVAVADSSTMTPQLGFASAVAEFGMLLRDSQHKGSSSFKKAQALAERYKGRDPFGHRAEFIRLIGEAERVLRTAATESR